jgi:hypothetical protein
MTAVLTWVGKRQEVTMFDEELDRGGIEATVACEAGNERQQLSSGLLLSTCEMCRLQGYTSRVIAGRHRVWCVRCDEWYRCCTSIFFQRTDASNTIM